MEEIVRQIPLGARQVIILAVILWDVVWKLIALWRAARNGQKVWFILIGVLNTVGILPIIYLLVTRKKAKA